MSTCARCRFSGNSNELGNLECHRFPPVSRANVWPLMAPNDWCGEWDQSAAVPAGGEQPAPKANTAWCQPMDEGKHKPRHFIVRFEDSERNEAVFTDEREAYEYFERASISWNCWLFGAMPLSPAPNGVSGAVREALERLSALADRVRYSWIGEDRYPRKALVGASVTVVADTIESIAFDLASLSREPSLSAGEES